MNIKLLLLCLLLPAGMLMAQKGTISGKVADKAAGFPISYATIVVKDQDKVVGGGITDDTGTFIVKNLDLRQFAVEIQYMGYKTHMASANLNASATVNLGQILLEDEATRLQDVTVVAERSTIEQKLDRKVVNVGKDLTTAGATASEIMNNIPSVNVDQDGRLSLRGNENVRVLIDGRPSNIEPAQLLKQIPSTSIKRIELITNPSAKYNPEGMSGIINIVLHKNASDGFNASVNSGLTVGVTPKINNSVNMNFRKGPVNFFGTYGNNFGQFYNEGDIRRFDDGSRQLFDVMNDDRSHLFKVGMDFYIDDKNTISVYTNQNIEDGYGRVYFNVDSPIPADGLFQNAIYRSETSNAAYNIAYKKLFNKEGETLDFEANYADYAGSQTATFDTDYDDPGQSDVFNRDSIDDTRKQTTINVDYVNPISKTATIELGSEARIIRSGNLYESDNEITATDYDYNLDIYSAYATFGQKLGKTSYQVGLRAESYEVNAILNGARVYHDQYFTVYPSASFVYSPTDNNQFQLSYSRRVDRPSLEQTRPVRQFATPRVTSVGNPELDPQFTNSVEVNYTRTFAKGSLTSGVFARQITNEISRIIYDDPENEGRQIMSFDNFDDRLAFGFEVSANYKITSWWDVQPAIDYSSIRQSGLVQVFDPVTNEPDFRKREVTAAAFNARLNSNFRASKQLRFLLFGFYRSSVDGIQFNSNEMYKIDAGARYSFLKDKATVSVRLNDIFNTQEYGFRQQYPFPQEGEFRWESRTLYIGFNFIFGAGKNRALQRKQRDDNTKQSGGGLF